MTSLISIGQLLDRSWDQYRERFSTYARVMGWLLVPTAIGILGALLYPPASKAILAGADFSALEWIGILLTALDVLVAAIFGVWLFISLLHVTERALSGARVDVRGAMREAWGWFWPMVLVSILVSLVAAAAGLALVPGLLLMAIGLLAKIELVGVLGTLLSFIGIAVSLVLMVRWTVSYSMAQYALVWDNVHGVAALRKSRALITGRFWSFLWRLLAPKIVFLLVALMVQQGLDYVFEQLIIFTSALHPDTLVRLTSIEGLVLTALIGFFINPLFVIADCFLYRSLKDTRV